MTEGLVEIEMFNYKIMADHNGSENKTAILGTLSQCPKISRAPAYGVTVFEFMLILTLLPTWTAGASEGSNKCMRGIAKIVSSMRSRTLSPTCKTVRVNSMHTFNVFPQILWIIFVPFLKYP